MKLFLYLAGFTAALVPAIAHAESSSLNSQSSTQMQTQTGTTAPMGSTTLTRTEIMQIQQALNDEGFLKAPVDGIWGPRTASALRSFQSQNSLEADGTLDTDTLNQLGVTLNSQTNTQSDTREMDNSTDSTSTSGSSNSSGSSGGSGY